MSRYIIKRILGMIPVVLAVAIVIFTFMYFCPGDPAEIVLGPGCTPAEYAAKRVDMGLEDPYLVQLGRFLKQTFIDFDLGESYVYSVPVISEIANRFPRTLMFALLCMFVRVLFGTPLGIISAVHQNRPLDQFISVGSLIFMSIPGFWLAMMMVLLFSLRLGWLPAYGIGGIRFWILPVLSSSLSAIASQAKVTRSAMLEVLRSDYVTTARAKGLSERTILYKHAFPNALIPLITWLGNGLASSLSGAIIVENIFSMPGMGSYLATGIAHRDYPIIRSVVVMLSITFCIVMLLVDLAYAFADPRIKAQYENQKPLFGHLFRKTVSLKGGSAE